MIRRNFLKNMIIFSAGAIILPTGLSLESTPKQLDLCAMNMGDLVDYINMDPNLQSFLIGANRSDPIPIIKFCDKSFLVNRYKPDICIQNIKTGKTNTTNIVFDEAKGDIILL